MIYKTSGYIKVNKEYIRQHPDEIFEIIDIFGNTIFSKLKFNGGSPSSKEIITRQIITSNGIVIFNRR